MGYLQLADGYSQLAENPKENYIFIPAGYKGAAKDMHVREDFFDSMPEMEYMEMMRDLAPFQAQGLSALPIAVAAGAAAKKLIDRRKQRIAIGTAKPLFKPGGIFSKIGAAIKGGAPAQSEAIIMERNLPISGGVNVGGAQLDFQTEPEQTFFQKNKTLLLIGGGLVLAGGIFLLTRKRR